MNHLSEIRRRLIYYSAIFLAAAVIAWSFSSALYTLFSRPLIQQMPESQKLIATSVASPFIVPIKLALTAAFMITLPWLFYQIWAFIKPGLYPSERRYTWLFLTLSTFLFYVGAAFAYFLTFPLAFGFFVHMTPDHVNFTPDINQYYTFAMQLMLAFGLSFELPIAIWLIVRLGLIDRSTLTRLRTYNIVGAFILGMLLTPPDVISQVLLALPLCLLFELGLLLAKLAENSVSH